MTRSVSAIRVVDIDIGDNIRTMMSARSMGNVGLNLIRYQGRFVVPVFGVRVHLSERCKAATVADIGGVQGRCTVRGQRGMMYT